VACVGAPLPKIPAPALSKRARHALSTKILRCCQQQNVAPLGRRRSRCSARPRAAGTTPGVVLRSRQVCEGCEVCRNAERWYRAGTDCRGRKAGGGAWVSCATRQRVSGCGASLVCWRATVVLVQCKTVIGRARPQWKRCALPYATERTQARASVAGPAAGAGCAGGVRRGECPAPLNRRRARRRTDHRPDSSNAVPLNTPMWLDTAGAALRFAQTPAPQSTLAHVVSEAARQASDRMGALAETSAARARGLRLGRSRLGGLERLTKASPSVVWPTAFDLYTQITIAMGWPQSGVPAEGGSRNAVGVALWRATTTGHRIVRRAFAGVIAATSIRALV
jgi:hypothetical protein